MKKILIFAGTTEGRRLSEILTASQIEHTISVATEYGELLTGEHMFAHVLCGRLNIEEMESLFWTEQFEIIVDATHPYAVHATENIKTAAEHVGVTYLRLRRETEAAWGDGSFRYFDSHEACVEALSEISGNILLTTGSKDLSVYCRNEMLRERLYVRVLPGMESLKICLENGISGKQVLALQGPFSMELNTALIRQYRISCLVTKQSGRTGGFSEKVQAACACGIPVFVIGNETFCDHGFGFSEICEKLEALCSVSIEQEPFFEISLVGIGMGSPECMTEAVKTAVREADFLFGAERLLESCHGQGEMTACYRGEDILFQLHTIRQREMAAGQRLRVSILFSGDSGFYSGTSSVFRLLQEEIRSGQLRGSIRILPGISSVSYLASAVGESYESAEIFSLHGRNVTNLTNKLLTCKTSFWLLGGAEDIRRIGKLLLSHGMKECEIVAGIRLSYPDQEILRMKPEACLTFNKSGLVTCMVKNPLAAAGYVGHGMADSEFIRGNVPMTKAEVRGVSICKLRLKKDSVVYDIGSGTGSVAVEMARISDQLQVFAIERKEEAVGLIRQNTEKHGLENIHIVPAEAPEGLMELPTPTHAFIGGSGKQMEKIFDVLYHKNPSMRIVANAVTMETAAEFLSLLKKYPVQDQEIVQMQINRTKEIGTYHMMQAENPVWICSFTWAGRQESEDHEA